MFDGGYFAPDYFAPDYFPREGLIGDPPQLLLYISI